MLSLTANSVTIRTFKDHMMVQGKSVQSVAIKVLKGMQVHVSLCHMFHMFHYKCIGYYLSGTGDWFIL